MPCISDIYIILKLLNKLDGDTGRIPLADLILTNNLGGEVVI